MSNEHKENEIDEIFRNAIEPVETEPSEEFWHKAAEDVIARGNTYAGKNISRWRIIAFILGGGLLILGYFSYTWEKGLNKAEQQIAKIENSSNQNTANTIAAKSNLPRITNITIASVDNSHRVAHKEKTTENEVRLKNTTHSNTGKGYNAISYAKASYQPLVKPMVVDSKERTKASAEVVIAAAKNKTLANKQDGSVNNSPNQENVTSDNLTSSNNAASVSNPPQKNNDSIVIQNTRFSVRNNQPTSLPVADTLKNISPSLNQASGAPRFSISAFFSPGFMLAYKFRSTEPSGIQCENLIHSDESPKNSYAAGVKAEYSFSSRFSISTGLGYQVYSFDIKPCVLYAQKQPNGDLGYSITTTSGVVECPDYGTTYAGDSLKMNASSSVSYLEIPLQVKYSFISKSRYQVYFNVGIEAGFYLTEKTTMNWQENWNYSGVSVVTGATGVKNMYIAYYAGTGFEYNFSKFLSLYIEPGLHEAITPLDNNIAVESYPRLISVTGGLTFHVN